MIKEYIKINLCVTWQPFFQYGFETSYYPLDYNQFSARLKNHKQHRITENFYEYLKIMKLITVLFARAFGANKTGGKLSIIRCDKYLFLHRLTYQSTIKTWFTFGPGQKSFDICWGSFTFIITYMQKCLIDFNISVCIYVQIFSTSVCHELR